MRRISKKHAARDRRATKARREWLRKQPACAICLLEAKRGDRSNHRIFPADDAHHIADRNASARQAIHEQIECPANWLAVCGAFGSNHHDLADSNNPSTCRMVWDAKRIFNPDEFKGKLLAELAPGKFGALARDMGLIK